MTAALALTWGPTPWLQPRAAARPTSRATARAGRGDRWLAERFSLLASRLGGETEELEPEQLAALIDAARGHDRVAAQRLYRALVDRVYRSVRPLVGNDSEAEDVTQDAMLKVLTSLDSYRPRPGARFISWVLAIAANTARRRFRRRRPELAEPEFFAARPAEAIEPGDAIDDARRRQALLAALGELPERERTVVSLRYGGELNATEIAAITGLTAANVRKVCERARDRLGVRIAELEAGGSAAHARPGPVTGVDLAANESLEAADA